MDYDKVKKNVEKIIESEVKLLLSCHTAIHCQVYEVLYFDLTKIIHKSIPPRFKEDFTEKYLDTLGKQVSEVIGEDFFMGIKG